MGIMSVHDKISYMNTHSTIVPKNLYVLPFDHQTGLWKVFGWTAPLTPDQESLMRKTRMITYEGYLHGLSLGIPKLETAILTDDIYGAEVLVRAKNENVPIIYTLEKSGQPQLIFAHDNWQELALHDRPDWIKTLVRYNPTANQQDLAVTRTHLKQVSDFARENGFGFMIEPLVPPTEEQKNIPDFDHVLRPDLTVQMITEIYQADIYPAIWKIEGSDQPDFYKKVSDEVGHYDSDAKIVVLGRNESLENVATWLTTGANDPSVIGFAVGRTVFLEAVKDFISGNITDKEAVNIIGKNYYDLYKVFHDKKESV